MKECFLPLPQGLPYFSIYPKPSVFLETFLIARSDGERAAGLLLCCRAGRRSLESWCEASASLARLFYAEVPSRPSQVGHQPPSWPCLFLFCL